MLLIFPIKMFGSGGLNTSQFCTVVVPPTEGSLFDPSMDIARWFDTTWVGGGGNDRCACVWLRIVTFVC